MTFVLDTRQMAATERASTIHDLIAATLVHVDITYAQNAPRAWGAITDLGNLRLCSVRSNATTVRRTPQASKDEVAPSIFVGLQMEGSSLVVQGGREALLSPGALVIWDTTRPYTLVDQGGIRQHSFRIPLSALALPPDLIARSTAVALTPGHPVAHLASSYFGRIASRPDLVTTSAATALGQPSVELVRALITTHLDVGGADDSHRVTTALRIQEYVRAHLSDPQMTPASIAGAHHISVRQLYNVLAEADISLGDWIRTQRLQACREDLRQPELRTLTIAAIARRWGFTNPSTFGRLFRSAYAQSPREWRDQEARR
jgi:AraC-like DNA-binding protein